MRHYQILLEHIKMRPYSNVPTPFSELTIAIATQAGATFHANVALTADPLFEGRIRS